MKNNAPSLPAKHRGCPKQPRCWRCRLGVGTYWRQLCWLFLLLLPFQSLAQPAEELENQLYQVDELINRASHSDSDTEIESLASQALELGKTTRYSTGILRASLLLGQVCARTGRPEKALRHFLEAEDRARLTNSRSSLVAIHRALGDLFYQQKLYANARRYYREVLTQTPNDLTVQERAGDAALAEARYDTAELYYKGLIVKYKNEGNNPRLVHLYQKLAAAYSESGDFGKSLLYYLRIEDIVERFGEPYEKGRLYNNLGKLYATLNDYRKSLEYFRKAELQCQYASGTDRSCELPEVFYTNIGIALHNTGDTKAGLEYLFKAQFILNGRKDLGALASLEHLIANVYFKSGDLYNALEHNRLAIDYAQKTNQSDVLTRTYKTAAEVYQDLYDFEKAFDYYTRYLDLLDSARLDEQRRQVILAERNSQLRSAEGEIRFLLAQQEIKDRDLRESRNEQDRLELTNRALASEAREREQELVLLQKQKEVDQATLREKTAQALQAAQQLRLAAQSLDAEKKSAIIAELRRKEQLDEAEALARNQEVELLRRDRDITDLRLRERANFERNTYIIGSLGLLFLLVLGIAWLYARRTGRRLRIQNREIEAQRDLISTERGKSDRLLRNILPEEIADELKARGHADPRLYDSATVVFTDFVNFTSLSANMSPEHLIGELDECFLAFDEIIERHGLEKIKTIGDAFMCAGGLPIPNQTHAIDAVRAALEMAQWLEQRNQDKPSAVFREMRIGIHTGPVVAGVIGKNKFAYDIWGDAVNLAARLEEQGEAGKVNVSRATFDAVKDHFSGIHRGHREVHNKGLVEMYFIDKAKD